MDRYKLLYEIKKRNVTVKKLCYEIGISQAAFYRKCNGKSQFTLKEIQDIVNFLGLPSPMGIFFNEKVS